MTQPADLSIVLPAYNHAHYLPRALDAILAQSLPAREVLVVDDASTDNTPQVLADYARRHPSVRVVRNEKNLGVVGAMNRGTELTTSSLLLYAAADDYVLPGFFEKAVGLINKHPHAGLCFAFDSCQFGEGGRIDPNPGHFPDRPGYFTPTEVCQHLRHTIPGHTTVCRRAAVMEQRMFAPELKWYCDWYALVSIAFRHGACHIPEMLSVRVLMDENYSAEAKPGDTHVAVLAAFFDHVLSPEAADVAPYFRRQGGATYFGTDLIRAAARRSDRWDAKVLGFLNGFCPEQYAELLADSDPRVRELAEFFLGPFWRHQSASRSQQAAEIGRLRDELDATRKRVPPPGMLAKLRWLAGLAARRLRRAG